MRKSIKDERVNEIYAAALDVFSKKGFDKATLDEIAKKVNITKPALYFYFKSKDDLFFSLIKSKFSKLNYIRNKIFEENISSILKIKRYVEEFVIFFKENKNFFQVLMNIQNFNFTFKKKNLKQKIKENMYSHLLKLKKVIEECIADGYLKEQNPLLLVFAIQGLINQLLFHSIHIQDFVNNEVLNVTADDIMSLFLNGAGTDKCKEEMKNEN